MPRAYYIHDLHIKILDKLMSVICKKVQNIYLYINVMRKTKINLGHIVIYLLQVR